MAADRPTHVEPDFFERHRRERELPVGIGVPEFEQALLLMQVHTTPGIRKSVLAREIRRLTGREDLHDRAFLRYIDCLEGLRYLYKSDGCRYTLTPSGKLRLEMLADQLRLGARMLSFWRA